MGTTREPGTGKVLLKPAKISKKKFNQLKKLWEADQKEDKIRTPFVPWLRKAKIAYIALDWKWDDDPELRAPMLSFFENLPSRAKTSKTLGTFGFVRWIDLPEKWLKEWKEDKAYSVESLFEKTEKE